MGIEIEEDFSTEFAREGEDGWWWCVLFGSRGLVGLCRYGFCEKELEEGGM